MKGDELSKKEGKTEMKIKKSKKKGKSRKDEHEEAEINIKREII
jgi:hypothetical protein